MSKIEDQLVGRLLSEAGTLGPDGAIVRAVCDKIIQRAEHGLKKYGVSVERTDLTLSQWLNHALEEAMDLSVYLERIYSLEDAPHEVRDIAIKMQNESIVTAMMMQYYINRIGQ